MTREEREDMWAEALAGMVIAEAKRLYGLPAPENPRKPRTPRKVVSTKPKRRHMRRKKAI